MSNIDRAAEVIEGYYPPCQTCRARATVGIPEVGECDECAKECRIIARALADARLLRPDLPKPDSGGEWADTRGAWVVSPLQGGTCVHVDDDLTPDETRDLADALYAAADHAEKEGTDGQDD